MTKKSLEYEIELKSFDINKAFEEVCEAFECRYIEKHLEQPPSFYTTKLKNIEVETCENRIYNTAIFIIEYDDPSEESE
ncbi:MAG TPA: hypothetical protein ENH85_00835 [Candidatus Scalindua sp.]|nr:hypothetical protein [Candidatus Scalindua sp.]